MFEKFHSENPLLKKELIQEPVKKKLPFSVYVLGKERKVVAEYGIEPEKIVGTCGECKRDGRSLFREKVMGEVKVDSDIPEIIVLVQDKIRELVKGVENEMLCCEDCFTEEFIQSRPKRYLQAMDIVSQRLGIIIDIQKLEDAIIV